MKGGHTNSVRLKDLWWGLSELYSKACRPISNTHQAQCISYPLLSLLLLPSFHATLIQTSHLCSTYLQGNGTNMVTTDKSLH